MLNLKLLAERDSRFFRTRFAGVIIVGVVSLGLAGCKADSNAFATSNSSVGSGDGSVADATAGFRVRVKPKSGVDSFLHKFGDATAACEVPLATIDTPSDVQCMLNMMEYDLWFYGYEYEFSVPANVCKFVIETPMYFYKMEAGQGPQIGTVATTDGNITACTIDSVAGTVSGGQCVGTEGTILPSGSVKCNYDYAKLYPDVTPPAPNCCTGTSVVVVTATVNPAQGVPTVTTSTVETKHGGKISNCIESAHNYISSWPKDAATQNAMSVIHELGASSVVRSTKVPSTFSAFTAGLRAGSSSNFLNAGFHDWNAYQTDASTYNLNRSIARAFEPQFDRGVNNNHALNVDPYLTATAMPSVGDGSQIFRCVGAAGETKHRIRLYVNEWNTVEQYLAYKANGDPSLTNPTETGIAGVDCGAVNLGNTCNSIWGYDDMILDAGGGPLIWEFPNEMLRGSPP